MGRVQDVARPGKTQNFRDAAPGSQPIVQKQRKAREPVPAGSRGLYNIYST